MGRARNIPSKIRELVHERDRRRCGRCAARGVEISHRRPRGIRDAHTHCLCNLVWSCRFCAHDFAHEQPRASRSEGWTLSREVKVPADHPVLYLHMWSMLECEGGIRMATTEEIARYGS